MKFETLLAGLALVLTVTLGLALAFAPLASALDVPPLSGRVNDYAGMISASAKAAIVQKLEQLEAKVSALEGAPSGTTRAASRPTSSST